MLYTARNTYTMHTIHTFIYNDVIKNEVSTPHAAHII